MTRMFVYSIALVTCVLLWANATTATGATPSEPSSQDAWSQASNGLQGRLSMYRSHVSNGTIIIGVYLDLKNVSDPGDRIYVAGDARDMKFRMVDAKGLDVPASHGPFSGPLLQLPERSISYDSILRYPIAPQGHGVPGDQAALVDLGPTFGWILPRDGKSYFLEGTLEIGRNGDNQERTRELWHGRLELPRARVPTEPEPIDPAKVESLIKELGVKMLTGTSGASEEAQRKLSLIDDPRVVPWYVKAMKTDNYSLKFTALDRLSRFEGDEALEGLEIGMATQGKDIGNCSTPDVAEGSADNIRAAAVHALARSPHPRAKALLLSMHDDRYAGVRTSVIQAASLQGTPESREVIERHVDDPDPIVRGEAVRLLNPENQ